MEHLLSLVLPGRSCDLGWDHSLQCLEVLALINIFPNPDDVGSSEYRAIHENLAFFLPDCPEFERAEMCESILEEFISHAQSMLEVLDEHLDKQEF